MNKLFLQNLRAEQSIQELRGEVKQAEEERQGTRGELSEADTQIRNLYGQLGQAEREMLDATYRLDTMHSESTKFQEAMLEAREERAELLCMLEAAEEDHARSLGMLEAGASVVLRERERMGMAGLAVSEQTAGFEQAEVETQDLQERLRVSEREAQGLRSELTLAAQLHASQSKILRSQRDAGTRQLHRYQGASEECTVLSTDVNRLEFICQRDRTMLTETEAMERRSAQRSLELDKAGDDCKCWQERLAQTQSDCEDAQAELDSNLAIAAGIQGEINKLVARHDEIHSVTLKRFQMKNDHAAETAQMERRCSDLQVAFQKAEMRWQQEEERVWQDLSEMSERLSDSRASFDRASEKRSEIAEEVERAAAESEAMEFRAENLESESERLRAEAQEYDLEAEELRAKPSCTVS